MSTDIAQFLWVEGQLSSMERLCLRSFLSHGYEVHLYTYGEVWGIPSGVLVKSGDSILPRSFVFTNRGVTGSKNSSYTAFADLFRLELLFRRGGWWFDMDMICLRHLDPPSDFLVASTWEGGYGECPCNCAIWAAKDDARIEELRDKAMMLVSARGSDLGVTETGVFPLQHFIREHALQDNVAPWWEFCPYPWRLVHRMAFRTYGDYARDSLREIKHRAWEMFYPDFKSARPRKGSRTVHFFNEIWKAAGLGKDESFFYLSPIEFYKRRYLSL